MCVDIWNQYPHCSSFVSSVFATPADFYLHYFSISSSQINLQPQDSTTTSTLSSWLSLTTTITTTTSTSASRPSHQQQASLRFLPAPHLASLLHKRTLSSPAPSTAQQQQQSLSVSEVTSQQQQACDIAVSRLQVAAWAGLQIGCVSRASAGDVSLRLMWANSTAGGLQVGGASTSRR